PGSEHSGTQPRQLRVVAAPEADISATRRCASRPSRPTPSFPSSAPGRDRKPWAPRPRLTLGLLSERGSLGLKGGKNRCRLTVGSQWTTSRLGTSLCLLVSDVLSLRGLPPAPWRPRSWQLSCSRRGRVC